MHLNNLEVEELFGCYHRFKVYKGAHYIGGSIRDDVSEGDWIKKRTDKWERDNCALSKTADKYTQESYAAVARAVQSEWIFLQRGIKDTVQAFTGLEKVLCETFLPRLLFGKPKILPPIV